MKPSDIEGLLKAVRDGLVSPDDAHARLAGVATEDLGFATIGASVPNFVLGVILIIPFAVQLKWLPAIGWSTGWTDWRPVILPTRLIPAG